jgi:hypothetical protein
MNEAVSNEVLMNKRPATGDDWHELGNELQAMAFQARSIEKREPAIESKTVS